MPCTLWQTLESIPGLAAEAAIWRAGLGDYFGVFSGFLQTSPGSPKELREGELRVQGGHSLPPSQPTWQLNRPKLGRALCQAFGFASKTAEFPLPATGQIGSWSAEAVPALLTIQSERREVRWVV